MPEVFFSLEATEMGGEAAKASREAATKNITNSQNDQLLDGSVGRGLHRLRTGQNKAPIKVPFSQAFLKVLQGV